MRTALLLLLLALISCKKATPDYLDGEAMFQVEVVYSSGELYGERHFLPLFGNLALLRGQEVIILSDKLEKGTRVSIDPIGLLEYRALGENKKVVFAVPSRKEIRTLPVEDLMDLSVNYAGVKRIIEQWYSSYNGLGKNEVVKWENKSAAISLLKVSVQN